MAARPSNFFLDVSGFDAEQLLMEYGIDGSFLARPSSSNPRDYTLSVRRGQHIAHIKIQRTGDFLDLYGGEKFATLSELVQYYVENPDQLREKDGDEIPLRCPVQLPSDVTASMPGVSGGGGERPLWCERWFHGNISARESELLLGTDNARNGTFLVRESQSAPGQLVLSVRVDVDEADSRFAVGNPASATAVGNNNPAFRCSHVMVRRKDGKLDVGGGEYFDSIHELLEFYRKNPMVEASGTVVYLKTPLHNTRVAASSIEGRMKALEQQEGTTGKFGYSVEFEDLQRLECKQYLQRKEGQRMENRGKNRYKNILPFDHTRIVLTDADPSIPGSDYINANYIEVFPDYPEFAGLEGRRYVSTQGCLSNTVDDFWRMVWQQNSRVIVMTTKEIERGRMKCLRYWPDGEGVTTEHGLQKEISVTLLTEDCSCADYKVRRFELNNKLFNEKPRTIYHWQFLGWPDHGCPSDPGSVLNFLDQVNGCLESSCPQDSGPIVIHCSAGIGRTGTFIVIDLILNQIKRVGLQWEVDVARTVQMVREQRSGMVQTEQQYWFIYLAVTHYIDTLRQHLDAACRTPGGREYTNIKYNNAVGGGNRVNNGIAEAPRLSPAKQPPTTQQTAPPMPPPKGSGREEASFVLEPPPLPKRQTAAATK